MLIGVGLQNAAQVSKACWTHKVASSTAALVHGALVCTSSILQAVQQTVGEAGQ